MLAVDPGAPREGQVLVAIIAPEPDRPPLTAPPAQENEVGWGVCASASCRHDRAKNPAAAPGYTGPWLARIADRLTSWNTLRSPDAAVSFCTRMDPRGTTTGRTRRQPPQGRRLTSSPMVRDASGCPVSLALRLDPGAAPDRPEDATGGGPKPEAAENVRSGSPRSSGE